MSTTGTRSVPFLDLRRQHSRLRAEIEEAVRSVLDGPRLILGPQVAMFEEEFAAFIGVPFAVGVASGTDAIELALLACGVGPGDEVVTVANAGAPTICAIEAAGATPVLADVDPRSLTLDPAAAEACITGRTRVLLPVHLYGQCADLAELRAVAGRHGLRVIEDCAQAHGATFDDRRAGSFGDAGCFSFYPTKNLGAVGDGGMIVTDDPVLAAAIRELRMYGESTPRHSTRGRGRNSRLDELQASILRVKLPHLATWNARRREIARAYSENLIALPLELPYEAERRMHVYHLYAMRTQHRDRLRARLWARGIATLVHYERPVHHHDAFRQSLGQSSLPVTERASAEIVSLPLYPELTDDEVSLVIEAVRDAV